MVVMVVIASLPYIAAPPPAHENAAKPTCFGVANARQEPLTIQMALMCYQ